MALDPGIRDLLQAIEEALAQQPAAERAEPRHARQVQEQRPQTRQRYHLWTRRRWSAFGEPDPSFGSGTTLPLPGPRGRRLLRVSGLLHEYPRQQAA